MTAPADKQYNELAARLARLETLLESNDALSPPGAVTLADMDLGPAVDFATPTYDQYMQNVRDSDVVWDPESQMFDGSQYQDWLDGLQSQNDGFSASQSAVDDMLARLGNIETFLSGGSNDTNQSGALDAGQSVGGDGQTGTGVPSTGTAVTSQYGYKNVFTVTSSGAGSFIVPSGIYDLGVILIGGGAGGAFGNGGQAGVGGASGACAIGLRVPVVPGQQITYTVGGGGIGGVAGYGSNGTDSTLTINGLTVTAGGGDFEGSGAFASSSLPISLPFFVMQCNQAWSYREVFGTGVYYPYRGGRGFMIPNFTVVSGYPGAGGNGGQAGLAGAAGLTGAAVFLYG